jgi:hypothetical protein
MPLFGLLPHPLFRLFTQVVDVVLGHQHADAVHELLARARVAGDDRVFLDEIDRDAEFIDCDPVLDVPVQAVGLLNQDRAAGRVGLQKGEHLPELRTSRLLGGLHIDELAENRQLVIAGVLAQQLLLRGDGESLTLLILRRHSRIRNCYCVPTRHSLCVTFLNCQGITQHVLDVPTPQYAGA